MQSVTFVLGGKLFSRHHYIARCLLRRIQHASVAHTLVRVLCFNAVVDRVVVRLFTINLLLNMHRLEWSKPSFNLMALWNSQGILHWGHSGRMLVFMCSLRDQPCLSCCTGWRKHRRELARSYLNSWPLFRLTDKKKAIFNKAAPLQIVQLIYGSEGRLLIDLHNFGMVLRAERGGLCLDLLSGTELLLCLTHLFLRQGEEWLPAKSLDRGICSCNSRVFFIC